MNPPEIDVDIHSISPTDFKKYELVDIREAHELVHDPSLIGCPHLPLSDLPAKLNFFKPDNTYLIFCHMGGRSHGLADYLNANGLCKALSVNGGVGALNAYVKEHSLA